MSVALTTTHENSSFQRRSKKVSVEIRPNQLLIFGRGKGGPFLVKEAPLAGIDLPFKALAWEDAQGKVWLSYPHRQLHGPEVRGQRRGRVGEEHR